MTQSDKLEKLSLRDVWAVLWRSFFVQAAWNFKSMISVGFCYALSPIAKKVCKNKEEYIDFLKRHLGFFNAHPYFASYAIGAIARLEQERQLNNKANDETIEKFKNALIGPLGAVGDQCCWAVIRPASLIFGLTGLAFTDNLIWKTGVLLLTLILYNIPHIYIRVQGILDGYRSGFDVYKKIRIDNYQKMIVLFKAVAIIGLGMLVVWNLDQAIRLDWKAILLFTVTMFGAFIMRLKKRMFYTPVLLSMVLAIIVGVL